MLYYSERLLPPFHHVCELPALNNFNDALKYSTNLITKLQTFCIKSFKLPTLLQLVASFVLTVLKKY